MINKNIKSALVVIAVFIMPCIFSACDGELEKRIDPSDINKIAPKNNDTVEKQGMIEEEIIMLDRVEFSDPGDDEIGNDIHKMDALLNQVTPSEYSEEDLSNDAIEKDVELR